MILFGPPIVQKPLAQCQLEKRHLEKSTKLFFFWDYLSGFDPAGLIDRRAHREPLFFSWYDKRLVFSGDCLDFFAKKVASFHIYKNQFSLRMLAITSRGFPGHWGYRQDLKGLWGSKWPLSKNIPFFPAPIFKYLKGRKVRKERFF